MMINAAGANVATALQGYHEQVAKTTSEIARTGSIIPEDIVQLKLDSIA